MALSKCPICGKQISNLSSVCIHCSAPLDAGRIKKTDVSGDEGKYISKNERVYSVELIDYADKKIQIALVLKKVFGMKDTDALRFVASAPCYLCRDLGERTAASIVKKLDVLPVEYKLYVNGNLKVHKLKSETTKPERDEAVLKAINKVNSGDQESSYPSGFAGREAYLSRNRHEEQPYFIRHTYNLTTNILICPKCRSTRIRRIRFSEKVLSRLAWGIFARKPYKQWHCKSCGKEW